MTFEALEIMPEPTLTLRQLCMKLHLSTKITIKDTKNAKLFEGTYPDVDEILLDRNIVTIKPVVLLGTIRLVIEVESIKKKGGRK